ncbi:MAG: hypothetical protein HFH82_08410 [Lachnospiraceae bacterium]|nr:hypothetical protein [Lachnospiraceae bacterium]
MGYTENDLVKIAQRENNKKRNYLVVNPMQGKHIPVSPGKALQIFAELANLLGEYQGEKLLIVGFAETATAIGAQVAITLKAQYIQTTREDMGNAACFNFSEEHSHATEQKLVKEDLDRVIGQIDRIIFAEDEVTTGKTILNIISVMEKCYQDLPEKIKFSVVSLLNGMTEEALEIYRERNIGVHYLVKTQHTDYHRIADRAVNDGTYYDKNVDCTKATASIAAEGAVNTRRITDTVEYTAACESLYDQMQGKISLSGREKVLILGTEEFMFPGLYVGKRLEEMGHLVRFHATTRSPINVSQDEAYPLHERYELDSLYDGERNTYVYDIGSYDIVLVITDAPAVEEQGVYSLLNAVRKKNKVVYLIHWR